MGTTEAEELKKALAELLERLGWSQKRLAREVYVATYDDEDEIEIKRLEERLKKEFQRKSTKPERLVEYLKIISRHREFEKLDLVLPVRPSRQSLSTDGATRMRRISKKISERLKSMNEL